MAPRRAKHKVFEVPPHIPLERIEAVRAQFPGEDRLIQQILREEAKNPPPPRSSRAPQAEMTSSLSAIPASGAIQAQTMSPFAFGTPATSKLIPGIAASIPSLRTSSPTPSVVESVASSKRPRGSSSGSSGPSVVAESVIGDYNSMALEYATPRANTPVQIAMSIESPSPLPPSDDGESITASDWAPIFECIDLAFEEIDTCPDVERLRSLTTRLYLKVAPQPQPQRDSVPRNADQSHPKKKVRVEPEPASSIPAPQGAVPIEVDAPAPPPPTPKKATPAVVPLPMSSKRPSPASAPPVSFASPVRKRRRGKHTTHGASRRGIVLTPPAGSNVTAGSFTPEVINSLNSSLKSDVKSDVILTHAVDGKGIFIAASRVPSPAEISFVLKHVRRLFPSATPIVQAPITSTSYLKMIDIPHVPAPPKDWARAQYEAFDKALKVSPVGASLANLIKHKPRFMRASPHSDSCTAWIDISDSVSGSRARDFISKVVVIGGRNCRILGARPHSGSVHCARCQRWGHHSSQCKAKLMRCPLCGGPHTEANHPQAVGTPHADKRHCVNCTAAKRPADKRTHASTDSKLCPFWHHRFDRDWLKRQFPAKEPQPASPAQRS